MLSMSFCRIDRSRKNWKDTENPWEYLSEWQRALPNGMMYGRREGRQGILACRGKPDIELLRAIDTPAMGR
jgi:hypothetical protein